MENGIIIHGEWHHYIWRMASLYMERCIAIPASRVMKEHLWLILY